MCVLHVPSAETGNDGGGRGKNSAWTRCPATRTMAPTIPATNCSTRGARETTGGVREGGHGRGVIVPAVVVDEHAALRGPRRPPRGLRLPVGVDVDAAGMRDVTAIRNVGKEEASLAHDHERPARGGRGLAGVAAAESPTSSSTRMRGKPAGRTALGGRSEGEVADVGLLLVMIPSSFHSC